MRAPRLFLEETLAANAKLTLTQERAHYLRNVMRARPGDAVTLFNGSDGEWQAKITGIERRDVVLQVEKQLRPPSRELGPEVFFAPLKRNRMELMIEKAVELGVSRLRPVITAHTVVERINAARLRSRVIEAAEQCERLTLPEIDEAIAVEDVPQDKEILFADEHGGGLPLLQALDASPDAAFLVGPEGGFSLEERDRLKSMPLIRPVTLGTSVLRAETASIFMLSVWRAWSDDEVEED